MYIILMGSVYKMAESVYDKNIGPCESVTVKCNPCLIQVTRLLMAVESGSINKWRDKQLEEITLDGNC